jgi:hypothetical protein
MALCVASCDMSESAWQGKRPMREPAALQGRSRAVWVVPSLKLLPPPKRRISAAPAATVTVPLPGSGARRGVSKLPHGRLQVSRSESGVQGVATRDGTRSPAACQKPACQKTSVRAYASPNFGRLEEEARARRRASDRHSEYDVHWQNWKDSALGTAPHW